jgi:hypothetical protein
VFIGEEKRGWDATTSLVLPRVLSTLAYLRVYKPHLDFCQEFGNNSYISRTRFHMCESKIFAIAFVALWLSLAAFTVICQ